MTEAGRFVCGARDGFHWFTSSRHRLGDLLDACPDMVLGKRLVVTSFDSGPLPLAPDEIAAGWVQQDAVATSPVVSDIRGLDADGWDEWYIFAKLPVLPAIEVFVNRGGFSLADPPDQTEPDPTWCHAATAAEKVSRREELDRFWRQMAAIGPESYVADGDLLNVVTADRRLFDHIRRSLDSE